MELSAAVRLRAGGALGPATTDGMVEAIAGPDRGLAAHPGHRRRGKDMQHRRRVHRPAPGDRVPFVLTWHPSHEPPPQPVDAERALRDTLSVLARLGSALHRTGPYRDAVDRSLITLKALTYAPTGGIVAAATTSLPEQIGGRPQLGLPLLLAARRHLHPAGPALRRLPRRGEGLAGLAAARRRRRPGRAADHVRRSTAPAGCPRPSCPGCPATRTPARCGSATRPPTSSSSTSGARSSTACTWPATPASATDDDAWDAASRAHDHLEGPWQQPDNGLWEMRGPRRHFVHSKVMAWVAADRMPAPSSAQHLHGPPTGGRPLGDDHPRRGLRQGLRPRPQHLHPVLRLHRARRRPAADPPRRLPAAGRPSGAGHHRGHPAANSPRTGSSSATRPAPPTTDCPVGKGVFLACSFWLVDALHLAGQQTEATALFERLLALRNDVGLLSEEWDPHAERQLGNTPQAFSHFPLVTSALQLHAGRAHHSNHPITPPG